MSAKRNDIFYATSTAVFVLVALIGLLLDYEKLAGLLAGIKFSFIFYAALLTITSYLAHSFSFWAACRIFKINAPPAELLEIGFVSSAITNVLMAAGIPGNTYRIIAMKKDRISAEDVTAVTVFHTYFNSAVFFLMFPASLLLIYNASFIDQKELFGLGAASFLFLTLFAASTAALFKKNLREKILRLISSAARLFGQKKGTAVYLEKFSEAIERGKAESQNRPFLLLWLIIFLVIDWTAMISVLGLSFAAFGTQVGFGKLLIGFTSGIVASAISFLPGGLGIFEGSMAGMFALLGTGLESAVLAVLLFRFVYYLLPFGLSLLFFGKIILRSRKETGGNT